MLENDILQEIPDDVIPEVLDILKLDYPHSFIMYQSLKTLLEFWRKSSKRCERLYSPGGSVDCGTYIIITTYPKVTLILAHCVKSDCHELIEAVANTNRIPWEESMVILAAIHDRIRLSLLTSLNEAGRNFGQLHDNVFWLPPQGADVPDLTPPAEVYLNFLTESNIPDVNRNWAYAFPASDILLKQWIRHFFGIGLFRRSDNKLLSYSVSNCTGGIFVLSTIPEERGKGYAPIIINAMTKEILRRGRIPFAAVTIGNEPSEKVFIKQKFEVAFVVGCLYDRNTVNK